MNLMNIEFMNQSKKEITVIIEPSTDEFVLMPKDTIKVMCESFEEITLVTTSIIDQENIVIWLPRATKGIVYINDVKVYSDSEMRYW